MGSGLKGDLHYLIESLRNHAALFWERYDVIPNCEEISFSASKVFLGFMGYDASLEMGVSASAASSSSDERNVESIMGGTTIGLPDILIDASTGERVRFGRPLGIDVAFLGIRGLMLTKMRREEENNNNHNHNNHKPNRIIIDIIIIIIIHNSNQEWCRSIEYIMFR
mmetsp:Transcript_11654/g.16508  ORF Transcript_11654/g.16508 Transcript_11654/m.16508 type:complete len:167 (-) Transcript_11654:1418-1918(-)